MIDRPALNTRYCLQELVALECMLEKQREEKKAFEERMRSEKEALDRLTSELAGETWDHFPVQFSIHKWSCNIMGRRGLRNSSIEKWCQVLIFCLIFDVFVYFSRR